MLKCTFSGLHDVAVSLITANFIHLGVVAFQIREIRKVLRKFEVISVQGHRSSCQWKAYMQLPISR